LALLGVVAFGLLWGRPWGLRAGLAAGYLGLSAVVLSTYLAWSSGRFSLRLEPLFQAPFLVALERRRKAWDNTPEQTAA
jgi:hypothetical protein